MVILTPSVLANIGGFQLKYLLFNKTAFII